MEIGTFGTGRGIPSSRRRLGGFSRADLLAVVAVGGLCGGAMFPVLAQPTSQSPMQICGSKLKEIGRLTAMFGADNQDRIWGFNWRINEINDTQYPDLRQRFTQDSEAAAAQAADILRRRSGRTFPLINGWAPMMGYSHLVLDDYAGRSQPSNAFTCPLDNYRLAWAANPTNFNNLGIPCPVPPGQLSDADRRWAYSASFRLPTHAWSVDRYVPGQGAAWKFLDMRSVQRMGSGSGIRERRLSEVAFPGSKVLLGDDGARHFESRTVMALYETAKQPLLFYDGVVRTEGTHYGNRGASIDNASGPAYQFNYTVNNTMQDRWMPLLRGGNGSGTATFNGWWYTTRMGLHGRDFFGAEVYP